MTHSSLSVVATQSVRLAQDTIPSTFDVSASSTDHEEPPSEVPARPAVVPAPAAQQCDASGQPTEFIHPMVSKDCSSLHVAPPSVDLIMTGPASSQVVTGGHARR